MSSPPNRSIRSPVAATGSSFLSSSALPAPKLKSNSSSFFSSLGAASAPKSKPFMSLTSPPSAIPPPPKSKSFPAAGCFFFFPMTSGPPYNFSAATLARSSLSAVFLDSSIALYKSASSSLLFFLSAFGFFSLSLLLSLFLLPLPSRSPELPVSSVLKCRFCSSK